MRHHSWGQPQTQNPNPDSQAGPRLPSVPGQSLRGQQERGTFTLQTLPEPAEARVSCATPGSQGPGGRQETGTATATPQQEACVWLGSTSPARGVRDQLWGGVLSLLDPALTADSEAEGLQVPRRVGKPHPVTFWGPRDRSGRLGQQGGRAQASASGGRMGAQAASWRRPACRAAKAWGSRFKVPGAGAGPGQGPPPLQALRPLPTSGNFHLRISSRQTGLTWSHSDPRPVSEATAPTRRPLGRTQAASPPQAITDGD